MGVVQFDGPVGDNLYLVSNFYDLEARGDLGRRPDGGGDGAILCIGQLDGVGEGFFRNAASVHDMVDMECGKRSGMVLSSLTLYFNPVSGDILAFF